MTTDRTTTNDHVERFTGAVNIDIRVGEAQSFVHETTLDEDLEHMRVVSYRPQRVTTNVPGPGLIYLHRLALNAVEVIMFGAVDAWTFNPNAVGQHLDTAVVRRRSKVVVEGHYTGRLYVPFLRQRQEDGLDGLVASTSLHGEKFVLSIAMTGPVVSSEV